MRDAVRYLWLSWVCVVQIAFGVWVARYSVGWDAVGAVVVFVAPPAGLWLVATWELAEHAWIQRALRRVLG